jgi:hypothetical protein
MRIAVSTICATSEHHPRRLCICLIQGQIPCGLRVKPIDVQISDWACAVEHEEEGSLSLRLGLGYAKGSMHPFRIFELSTPTWTIALVLAMASKRTKVSCFFIGHHLCLESDIYLLRGIRFEDRSTISGHFSVPCRAFREICPHSFQIQRAAARDRPAPWRRRAK